MQHLSDSEQTGAFSVQPSIQLSKNLGSDPGFAISHYLGRYTHRVAISNNRILNVRNGQVTFKWRDYDYANKLIAEKKFEQLEMYTVGLIMGIN